MVQSINTKAILTLASVARRPGLMVPHVSVANVSEIDFGKLRSEAGVRAVVFDKDNTLTGPYESSIHPAAAAGLKEAIETFGQRNVAILSNSAGTGDDPGFRDAIHIEESLGIAVIRHKEKKPGGLKEVLGHFQLDDAAHCCMVGDRILTDVVFGNLYGLLSVHTLPLCVGEDNKKDNIMAKIMRPLENRLVYRSLFARWFLRIPSHKHWQGPSVTPLVKADATISDNEEDKKLM